MYQGDNMLSLLLAVNLVAGYILMPAMESSSVVQLPSVFVREVDREKRWGKEFNTLYLN